MPAIFNNHLILFHLQNGFEIIESRDAETEKSVGVTNIQLNIVIDMDTPMVLEQVRLSGTDVYAQGVTAWLTCLELETGKLLWERDLKKEFLIPDYFFGKGSNPIVSANSLILNIGGRK